MTAATRGYCGCLGYGTAFRGKAMLAAMESCTGTDNDFRPSDGFKTNRQMDSLHAEGYEQNGV